MLSSSSWRLNRTRDRLLIRTLIRALKSTAMDVALE